MGEKTTESPYVAHAIVVPVSVVAPVSAFVPVSPLGVPESPLGVVPLVLLEEQPAIETTRAHTVAPSDPSAIAHTLMDLFIVTPPCASE
jgi:hypothetical protein